MVGGTLSIDESNIIKDHNEGFAFFCCFLMASNEEKIRPSQVITYPQELLKIYRIETGVYGARERDRKEIYERK